MRSVKHLISLNTVAPPVPIYNAAARESTRVRSAPRPTSPPPRPFSSLSRNVIQILIYPAVRGSRREETRLAARGAKSLPMNHRWLWRFAAKFLADCRIDRRISLARIKSITRSAAAPRSLHGGEISMADEEERVAGCVRGRQVSPTGVLLAHKARIIPGALIPSRTEWRKRAWILAGGSRQDRDRA